jgi:hypothetical protein
MRAMILPYDNPCVLVRKEGKMVVLETSLGRRNIPMELWVRDSRSSLFEKEKKKTDMTGGCH